MTNINQIYELNSLIDISIDEFEKAKKKLSLLRIIKIGINILSLLIIIVMTIIIISNRNVDISIKSKNSANNTIKYYKTSFNCNKAFTYVEKTICTDSDLAKLDLSLANIYKTKLSETKDKLSLKSQQKTWVQDVQAACSDKTCISDAVIARINELKGKKDFIF